MKLLRFYNKLIPFQVKINLNYVDFMAEEFVWLNLLPLGSDNYVSTQYITTYKRELLTIMSILQPKEVPIVVLGHCYNRFQPMNMTGDITVKKIFYEQ